MKCKDCEHLYKFSSGSDSTVDGICKDVSCNAMGVFLDDECHKPPKPKMNMKGLDGNIFSILGEASECLRKADQRDKIEEMRSKVYKSHSYDEALCIIGDYVEFTAIGGRG